MEGAILEVSDAEQRRIGQDLHDGLGQHLTGVALLAKALERRVGREAPGAAAEAGRVAALVDEAVGRARDVARGLSPVELETEGLRPALEHLVAGMTGAAGAEGAVVWDDGVAVEDPVVALHLYRIAQEAVSNAVRHGKAGRVEVRVGRGRRGRVKLSVADDGIGIAEPGVPGRPGGGGMGLRTMDYRCRLIGGGGLRVARGRRGTGTVVSCAVAAADDDDGGAMVVNQFEAAATAASARRVLLVDDHPIVREGLVRLLEAERDLVVAGQAGGEAEALEAIGRVRPDVVVLDLSLGAGSGMDLLRAVGGAQATPPVLVLSMHDEALHAERVLRLGARGYVMKQEATGTLVGAIRRVLRGEIHLSERMASRMLRGLTGGGRGDEGPATALGRLSDREMQVFEMIGRGDAPRDIARKLGLSVKTVDAHRERIKEKLHVRNGNDLVRVAVSYHLGRPDLGTLPTAP